MPHLMMCSVLLGSSFSTSRLVRLSMNGRNTCIKPIPSCLWVYNILLRRLMVHTICFFDSIKAGVKDALYGPPY